jgi:hypothetical protein
MVPTAAEIPDAFRITIGQKADEASGAGQGGGLREGVLIKRRGGRAQPATHVVARPGPRRSRRRHQRLPQVSDLVTALGLPGVRVVQGLTRQRA